MSSFPSLNLMVHLHIVPITSAVRVLKYEVLVWAELIVGAAARDISVMCLLRLHSGLRPSDQPLNRQ